MYVTWCYWWLVNIGSGNGWVPSGNKPLPKANVDPDLCRHIASLGHNELIRNAAIYLSPGENFGLTIKSSNQSRDIALSYKHTASIHRHFVCLFNNVFGLQQRNINVQQYSDFVRVDSPYNGKAFHIKNKARNAAYTIVSWHKAKLWLMIHIGDLVVITNVFSQSSKKKRVSWCQHSISPYGVDCRLLYLQVQSNKLPHKSHNALVCINICHKLLSGHLSGLI